jgi:hypothetical protein
VLDHPQSLYTRALRRLCCAALLDTGAQLSPQSVLVQRLRHMGCDASTTVALTCRRYSAWMCTPSFAVGCSQAAKFLFRENARRGEAT